MDPQFWFDRWERNQIGFHEGEANTMLVTHFGALGLAENSRVFVPLCGKTRDIAWLLSKGQRVVGAELSELAIRQLFAELGVEPAVSLAGNLMHFAAPGIDIFVGNIFDLTKAVLGQVDAIYDRAALVALPPEMRDRYATRLVMISDAAPQLLICFEYDQSVRDGPPFSVTGEEVARLYGGRFAISLIDSGPLDGGVRGTPARDAVWLLR